MSGVQAAGALMLLGVVVWAAAEAIVWTVNTACDSRLAKHVARAEAAMRSAALAFDDAWDDVADLFTGPRDELAARRVKR